MLTCREVTRLLTLEAEQPIGQFRRIAVTFHLAICHNCRRNRRQLKQIQHYLAQTKLAELSQADYPLDEATRERIATQLKSQSNNPLEND